MAITFHPDGRGTGGTIKSSGNIIQVQSGFVNAQQHMSSTTFADITGLTVTLSNVQSGSKVYIFDRFGKLLKELDPLSKGWDGTYLGKPMPATDYWFRTFLGGWQRI